jgi:hypothetical protein
MRSVVEAQAAPLVDEGVRAQALGIAAAEFGEIRVKLVLRKPLGSRYVRLDRGVFQDPAQWQALRPPRAACRIF